MSNDVYTAKAVSNAAVTLGYWIVAASLLHAVVHPIMAVGVAKLAIQKTAENASGVMDKYRETMQRNMQRMQP
jgi:hypothetical protein